MAEKQTEQERLKNKAVSKPMASLPAIGHSITGLFIMLLAGMKDNPEMLSEYGFPAGLAAMAGQVIAWVSSQKNQKDTEKAKIAAETEMPTLPPGIDEIAHGLSIVMAKACAIKHTKLVEDIAKALKTQSEPFIPAKAREEGDA